MFSNGFIMGFVMESLQRKGQDALFMLKGLTPHGIFELPALFIAGAAGLRIGFSYITTDRKNRHIMHPKASEKRQPQKY